MRSQKGFNLVELMVAIAISTTVIMALVASFSSVHNSFLFNSNKIELQQSLRYSIQLMKEDLQNAGTFGSFSFHNQSAIGAYESITIGSGCSGSDWCSFQTMGVGVKSYNSGTSISGSGISSTSDILRVQLGGYKIAYFNSATVTPPIITNLQFIVPSGNATTAKTYMLAATNHSYLIDLGTGATANSQLTGFNIPIESSANGILHDPDQSSLTLVPFITKYYFVNSNGLQVVQYDGTSLSNPLVISARITSMSVSYKIDEISSNNYNHYGAGTNTYAWCTTADMNNVSKSLCYNKWAKISAVSITLAGVTSQNVSTSQSILTQTETDSVGWQW